MSSSDFLSGAITRKHLASADRAYSSISGPTQTPDPCSPDRVTLPTKEQCGQQKVTLPTKPQCGPQKVTLPTKPPRKPKK